MALTGVVLKSSINFEPVLTMGFAYLPKHFRRIIRERQKELLALRIKNNYVAFDDSYSGNAKAK